MDVSIIIVNYCTADLVIAAVESLIRQTKGVSYEVLIVDNASPDESGSQLQQKYNDTECVRVLKSNVNLGFGGANNLGYSESVGRNIFFLNPDTLILNDAVSILATYLDDNDMVGVCGGNLFDSEGAPASSFRRLFPSVLSELSSMMCHLPEKIMWGRNSSFNHTGKVLDVAFIVGADLMIKRDVIEKVGLFDLAFFMYYEETDLCRRVKDAHYKIHSVPFARICHLEGKSIANLDRKAEINFKSRHIYLRKHHSPSYVYVCDIFFKIAIHLRLGYLYITGRENKYWSTMKKCFLNDEGSSHYTIS